MVLVGLVLVGLLALFFMGGASVTDVDDSMPFFTLGVMMFAFFSLLLWFHGNQAGQVVIQSEAVKKGYGQFTTTIKENEPKTKFEWNNTDKEVE